MLRPIIAKAMSVGAVPHAGKEGASLVFSKPNVRTVVTQASAGRFRIQFRVRDDQRCSEEMYNGEAVSIDPYALASYL